MRMLRRLRADPYCQGGWFSRLLSE